MEIVVRLSRRCDRIAGSRRTRRPGKLVFMFGRKKHWYLRVLLLENGETVHNAFFDRRFKP